VKVITLEPGTHRLTGLDCDGLDHIERKAGETLIEGNASWFWSPPWEGFSPIVVTVLETATLELHPPHVKTEQPLWQ